MSKLVQAQAGTGPLFCASDQRGRGSRLVTQSAACASRKEILVSLLAGTPNSYICFSWNTAHLFDEREAKDLVHCPKLMI